MSTSAPAAGISSEPDLVDALCDLAPGTPTHAIRHGRDKVVAATRGSHGALFDPNLAGITLQQRLLVALHASRLSASADLAAHYRKRCLAAGCDPALIDAVETGAIDTIDEPLARATLRFTTTLIERPIAADKAALQRLPQAGLTTPAIIALAQLIAYLSYQIRLVAGLRAMKASVTPPTAGAGSTPGMSPGMTTPVTQREVRTITQQEAQLSSQSTTGTPAALPAGTEPVRIKGFTSEPLEWSAWLEVVDIGRATPEQLAVLKESHPKATDSDYYRVLVHQPLILRERSAAFNAIMYAPGGLPRAERELASTVVSRINGCVYCASVHAQRFAQLAKRDDTIRQVFEDPHGAGTNPRERAIVAFSIAMTEAPQRIGVADIDALKSTGLDDAGVLDLLHSVAIFAWANRLMLNLGEPVYAD